MSEAQLFKPTPIRSRFMFCVVAALHPPVRVFLRPHLGHGGIAEKYRLTYNFNYTQQPEHSMSTQTYLFPQRAKQLASGATRVGRTSRCICSFRRGGWNVARGVKSVDGLWRWREWHPGSTTVSDRVLDKVRDYAAIASNSGGNGYSTCCSHCLKW